MCASVWVWGEGFRPEQEVWDPESWGSHVRMWPSSALPWQASAPSVLPAGRPARSPPPRHIWTHKGVHFLSHGRAVTDELSLGAERELA